jgi:redox-regulated HSP33 family molecular chaperone
VNAVVPYKDSRAILAKKKRRVFLGVLAQTGRVSEAARACGFTDTSTLQKFRRNDEDFAEAWDHALEAAAHVLEEEAIRRATEGVLEPVFYKGKVTGYKTNYSDTLMMFILRGLKPSVYRENARGGDVNVNFGIAVLPMTAQSDEQWENRAVLMHKEQKVITIEAKPVENQMARIKRGD